MRQGEKAQQLASCKDQSHQGGTAAQGSRQAAPPRRLRRPGHGNQHQSRHVERVEGTLVQLQSVGGGFKASPVAAAEKGTHGTVAHLPWVTGDVQKVARGDRELQRRTRRGLRRTQV